MIAECRAAGVSHFLVPATDAQNLDSTIRLAQSSEGMYCALGIHPHSANEWNGEVRERIRETVTASKKAVAIGEIGLDYHYDFSPREVQRRAFSEQIELAIELNKPIVIHTRESEGDVFRIIEEQYASLSPDVPRGQFHCFSLGHEFLQRALSLGFHISFTGNITFKNSNLASVVESTPLDRLLIETDSPYLAPAPYRGRRNSPAYLPFIAQKVADLKHLDLSTAMQQIFENTLRLFRISLPILLGLMLVSGIGAERVKAQVRQPAGIQSPDSILTGNRRQAEELRKKQEAELAREAEQHRIDSLKAAQKSLEEAQAQARVKMRQDSIREYQEALDAQEHAAFLLTPEPWRAIGIGANIGGGSMHIGTPILVSTSVFAYGFQMMTEVTRRLDISANYTHFQVSGDFTPDSIWSSGANSPPTLGYKSSNFHPSETRLIRSESLDVSDIGVDLHYTITRPTALIKFYFGLGFHHLMMASRQHYFHMIDSLTPLGGNGAPVDSVNVLNWSRNGINLLFGMKHDFELGNGLTIEPFGEISAMGVFNGQNQGPSFVFQPDQTALIVVNFRAGFTLYYGWWGVKREE